MKTKWQVGLITLLILISFRYMTEINFKAPTIGSLTPATVTKIIDGDTLDVLVNGSQIRIRLIGVDTPEKDQRGYSEAKLFTAKQAPIGSIVYLESDINDTDFYGRSLRYVWLRSNATDFDQSCLNGLLLKEDLGKPLWMNGDVKYKP